MDGSGLTSFLTSLILSMVLASVVRPLACRLSLRARAPGAEAGSAPVPLLGGVALVGGASAGLFVSGGLVGLLPLLMCSLLMAAVGLIRDLWPVRPASLLVGQFVVAALVLNIVAPIDLVGGLVADTLLTMVWLVAVGGVLTALDRLPHVALVTGVAAALLPLFVGSSPPQVAIQWALLAAAGAASGLLIYTLAIRPLLPGHIGTLFLGGWLAAAALVAPHLQASHMLATGAPVAIAFVAVRIYSWFSGRGVSTRAGGWSTMGLFQNRGQEVLVDVALVTASYYVAFGIRFDDPQFTEFLPYFAKSLPVVIGCELAALWLVGKYHRLRFVPGITDAVTIAKGVTFGVASAVVLLLYLYRFEGFSRQVFAMHGAIFSFLLVSYPMLIGGADHALKPRRHARRVLIYGAGRAGALLLRELTQNEELSMIPVGFIDDDPANRRLKLDGLPVLGAVEDLPAVLVRQTISEVLISVKNLPPVHLAALANTCREHGVGIRRMRLTLEEVEPAASTMELEEAGAAAQRLTAEPQITSSSPRH